MSGNYESIINTAIDADFFPLTKLFINKPFQPRLTSLNQILSMKDVVMWWSVIA